MKRLWLAFLCTACATTEPAKQSAAPGAEGARGECPLTRSTASGAPDAVLGKRVEKICVVGGPTDLAKLVAGLQGQPLEAARVDQLLHELFATGLVRDAEAVATPLDGDSVLLSWFIVPYEAITTVRVVGAQAVGSEAFVQLTPERYAYASSTTLKALRDAVRESYEERGYPRAKVAVAMEHGEAVVTVNEGTRDDVKRIRFSGAKKAKEAELREVVHTLEGSVFVADLPARDVMHLEDFYRDRGMVQAKVTSSYEDGELLFTVSEGDVFKLGTLKLTGTAVADAPALLASLGSKRGSVFSRSALRRDIERIREHAGRKGTPVNVTPLTAINDKKKTIDVTFELSPTG